MRKSGIMPVADELGIPLADFDHGREVEFKDSPFTKLFTIAKGALECDGLVNIPKLKTHGLMRMTGAVKNQFGCVPGVVTHGLHIKIPNPYDFARMLVSLNILLNTRLSILDGIMAMEGNGPRGGKPVKMNLLLFSKDPVAIDTVMCRCIGLEPEIVPTNPIGMEYGLGTCSMDEIELVGDPINELINKDFDVLRTPVPSQDMHRIPSFIKQAIFARPVIDSERCSKCGVCVKVCKVEPKAINWSDSSNKIPPAYSYERCIRCFCCQELCPENAIYIKQPLVRKLLTRKVKRGASSREGRM
jgi:NAD-dependent dihydropyrimidine dehydrogenase PreA subunit